MSAKEDISNTLIRAFNEAWDCETQPWRTIVNEEDGIIYEVRVSVVKHELKLNSDN